MANKLKDKDRDILSFRPNIDFVEPEIEPGVIEGEDQVDTADIEERTRFLANYAKSVNLLAKMAQKRFDVCAEEMRVALDRKVDMATVQSMRRRFPEADPFYITYTQYRACKDSITQTGINIGKQALITPEDIAKAKNDIDNNNFDIGGFGSAGANQGGLRPELDSQLQIIPPLDIEEVNIRLICIFVNFIWKNFILPAFGGIGLPPPLDKIKNLLPQEICNPGADIEIPGLFILGQKPPKKQDEPEIPEDIAEEFPPQDTGA